ncbi:hypothetical protein ANCDUO_16753 [Ancylostoma duodenale]|uniref:Uncharacterized protein n=1 Tax=Ancylostoma duodenale TaxID=51022 RepID=A0A0C2G2K7_9BILA|nr:hypothetical protein ANCDUO_16753 [Ancylostoma duodenale]
MEAKHWTQQALVTQKSGCGKLQKFEIIEFRRNPRTGGKPKNVMNLSNENCGTMGCSYRDAVQTARVKNSGPDLKDGDQFSHRRRIEVVSNEASSDFES